MIERGRNGLKRGSSNTPYITQIMSSAEKSEEMYLKQEMMSQW